MALNITTAVIGSGCNAATASPSLVQWDKGQILQISGVELPETYKVEFSNGDTLEAIPAIGTAEGVEIPDKLLYSSSPIRAYIVLSEAEGERNTEYWVTIYVKPREIPEDIEPDPAQQDVIDDLIAQLNTGVGKAEAAADEAEAASQAVQDLGVRAETLASGAPAAVQKIVDAETGAVTLVFFLPQGEAGVSPVVTVTTITGGHRVTVTDADGAHSFDVMDGRSVTGVTMGADYKLTFTFSDGTTWTTPTSIRGETGATPRLTIGTVSTLDPGQSATAEITGTPEDPVLNFGIPKGQAGASDAGAVTYNPETAYNDGTVGKAVSDLSRQLSDLEDTVSTTQIINTASGAIASFDDGADNMPVRKLVANIEPVQDLHGYENPWPGGGGKNIFRCYDNNTFSRNGLTVEMHGHYITMSGTVTENTNVNLTFGVGANVGSPLENNTNYTWSAKSEGTIPSGMSIYGGFTGDATSQTNVFHIDGSATIKTAATGNLVDRVWITTHAGEVYNGTLYIQTEKGSVKTAFEPWENICPISGHTGAEVEQTGKNLFDFKSDYSDWSNGYLRTDGTPSQSTPTAPAYERTSPFIAVKGGQTYTLSYTPNTTSQLSNNCAFYDSDKNFISGTFYGVYGVSQYTRQAPENAAYFRFSCRTYNSATEYQLELGSTATAYEPYTGNQISVNWEDEAGTVYGGTLTVNPDRTGQLVVDRASFNWTSGGYLTSRGAWAINKADVVTINAGNQTTLKGTVCDKLPSETWAQISNDANASSAGCVFGNGLAFRIAGFTTAEEYIAFLADNPLQFAYLLKEPITYQLTSEQISDILNTLYGTNNIWADTGDTEVTYPADTKLYIDGKIAEAIAALNS